MRSHPAVETAEPQVISSPPRLRAILTEVLKWPSAQFDRNNHPQPGRVALAVIGTAIVLSAVGIRLLYWEDKHVDIVAGKTSLSGVFNRYQKEAHRIYEDGSILFPRVQPVDGDARLLAHPPGYSILIAAIYRLGGDEYKWLWILQILCDAAAALLVFLIGLELLNWWVALTAALLVTLSPHLAYYSLLLSPDSLAVPPILLAVYLVIRGLKRPKASGMMLAGALIGLSCWLTANAMLLSLFLGGAVVLLFERGRRLILGLVLVGSTIVIIAPLTIRNFVVFHRFIPLSIQAGLSLVEGIGDYDKDGKFGMPRSDREARYKDAEWNARPEYAASLWSPNGIERDRIRLDRGLSVVRSNPRWFLGVIAQRALFMLTYNDSGAREWPFNTASVPPLFSEAGYGHTFEVGHKEPASQTDPLPVLALNGAIISGLLADTNGQSAKSISPSELTDSGIVLSSEARVSLVPDGQALEVAGDSSEYRDQFMSLPIVVQKNTDHVLALPMRLLHGNMALKVTSDDRRITLAIVDIARATQESGSTGASGAYDAGATGTTTVQMPFASGNRTEIRVAVSNNGKEPLPPAVQLGTAQIFEIGPTPYVWTQNARIIARSIQRKFTTGRMITLILAGIALLLLARRGRTVVILLVVPLYYLTLQAPLHTEYRYVLTIHYFLFVMAGVTLGCFGASLVQASRWVVRRCSKQLTA